MNAWTEVMAQVLAVHREFNFAEESIFYRGHRDAGWPLLPSLGRHKCDIAAFENHCYYALKSRAGHLLPDAMGVWSSLFIMQHHGFPTRLLDWSDSFAVALYFAIHDSNQSAHIGESAAVWLVNGDRLNRMMVGDDAHIAFLDTDLPVGYENYFANIRGDHYGKFPHEAVALVGDARSERLRAQRGVFTLHRNPKVPLEILAPSCVRKVEIPREAEADAKQFLELAGVSGYALFPELDALAKDIIQLWL